MARPLAVPDSVTDSTTCVETIAALTASRARVVASADENRRRWERDLHRGPQERLSHVVIALTMARDALAAGSPPDGLIDEALAHAQQATRALGDVAHTMLPPILVHGGLRAGVESVIADLGLAVEVRVATPRLPSATETTAFLVIAEALTNVAGHACAERVGVDVELNGGVLALEVHDDGVGGADPARGHGLTGLIDRVDAAGGTVTITSAPGAGTTLRAALPVAFR